ncbi:uncharacterized protein METZ01_LOCUS312660, partial [marine metagenome]
MDLNALYELLLPICRRFRHFDLEIMKSRYKRFMEIINIYRFCVTVVHYNTDSLVRMFIPGNRTSSC